MTGHGRKNADSQLLVALSTGKTVSEAAAESGVSESTVYRRLGEADFQNELNRIKDAILASTVARLSDCCSQAVTTLRELLDCGSPNTRLGAARSILEMSVSLRTNVDFAERITRLEERKNVQLKRTV